MLNPSYLIVLVTDVGLSEETDIATPNQQRSLAYPVSQDVYALYYVSFPACSLKCATLYFSRLSLVFGDCSLTCINQLFLARLAQCLGKKVGAGYGYACWTFLGILAPPKHKMCYSNLCRVLIESQQRVSASFSSS